MIRPEEALAYHSEGRPGKIEVVPTKPVASQRDLSLAYTPGVAEPCREIEKNREMVGKYTARRNLVAVVTNGTAVLGLGDIGPYAAKPVMEGKAVLFKRYADIDVFDLEIAEKDPHKLIEIVVSLEPTFGGINLEDIKAPECFQIERALRERMRIPVFHDDQHGTAIITTAALKNAANVQKKELAALQVVCVGAGASAIACMELWVKLGVRRENVLLIDSKGVVREGRAAPLDEFKRRFVRPANDPRTTLEEALRGADVLVGLSSGGRVPPELLSRMAPRPIIMALANPDPEVGYDEAVGARPDAVVATGRSDFPNQVNNVLGFPYVFRGALDVGATTVNDDMKLAAAHAIADLAREAVPDYVLAAYGNTPLEFGPNYFIPKPVDARVLYWVAPAVAKAALESGVATEKIDIDAYRASLERKVSPARKVLWQVMSMASRDPRRIVFPEGAEDKILRAAEIAAEGPAIPVLIGEEDTIRARASAIKVDLARVEIVDPRKSARFSYYVDQFFALRHRKGLTHSDAERYLRRSPTYFGMMMVKTGDADGLVSGLTRSYAETIRPALEIIGVRPGISRAAGMYIVITKDDVKFLADTTINIEPDARTVSETAVLAADVVRDLGIEPRIAMLSFSNFGDAPHASSRKMAEAAALVRERRPELSVDGEMQADVALDPDARAAAYPFNKLKGSANVLVFPSLDAGNIACRLLAATTRSEIIGPLVLGLQRPVNVLQRGISVDGIVHVTALTAAAAIRAARAKA